MIWHPDLVALSMTTSAEGAKPTYRDSTKSRAWQEERFRVSRPSPETRYERLYGHRFRRRLAQSHSALGPHDRGHRLGRRLVLLHLAGQSPEAAARPGRRRQGHRRRGLGGPWRRLLHRQEIHPGAREASARAALVQVGSLHHPDNGLFPSLPALLLRRRDRPYRPFGDATFQVRSDLI